MRLFVSIDLPEHDLKTIHSWMPKLDGWKKVSTNQMHLTLVFLGECTEQQKIQIHEQLANIIFTPFQIKVGGLGAFPNKSNPRIIWAAVQQNDQLMNLQSKISDQLNDVVDLSNNHQSFIPHITIARKKSGKGIRQVEQMVVQKDTSSITARIESFQLKQSILKPSGSQHEILNSYSFK